MTTTTIQLETLTREAMASVLASVINLHTDVKTGPKNRGKSGLRARCTECGFAYPCSTIEIIRNGVE